MCAENADPKSAKNTVKPSAQSFYDLGFEFVIAAHKHLDEVDPR